MALHLGEPLHGDHQWRQAHYVANVERFLADGISLTPSTYNFDQPAHMYDFPLYQYAATLICRATGLDAIVVCRGMSIILFVLTFLGFARVLSRLRLTPLHGTWTLALFATSPVLLHFFQTPLADNLALCLSIASFLCYLVWREESRRAMFVAMLATGFFGTLIKAPVHFPCFVAMGVHTCRGGARNLLRRDFLGYAGVLALAVLTFLLVSRAVNGDAAASGADFRWYFGTLGDRVDAGVWLDLLRDIGVELLNPALALLAIAGAVRARGAVWRVPVAGWLLGVSITVLLLLRLIATHNYYLMPLAFPFVILAGSGCAACVEVLRKRVPNAVATAIVALAVVPSLVTYHRLETFEAPEYRVGTGRWLQARTTPRDFVFYLYWKEGNYWDPQYLFHAKRQGFNLRLHLLRSTDLDAIAAEHAGGFERLLIFAEAHLHDRVAGRLASLPRCELLEAGERGRIYEYRRQ